MIKLPRLVIGKVIQRIALKFAAICPYIFFVISHIISEIPRCKIGEENLTAHSASPKKDVVR